MCQQVTTSRRKFYYFLNKATVKTETMSKHNTVMQPLPLGWLRTADHCIPGSTGCGSVSLWHTNILLHRPLQSHYTSRFLPAAGMWHMPVGVRFTLKSLVVLRSSQLLSLDLDSLTHCQWKPRHMGSSFYGPQDEAHSQAASLWVE